MALVLRPGDKTESGDIYLGRWQPKDRSGRSLGKTFNVFAAPEDLTDGSGKKLVRTFQDMAGELAVKRNWHGHDGGDFANDAALYKGLENGKAIGQWFMPTRELLHGKDVDGNMVQSDNLYAHKDTGVFKGTYTMSDSEHRDYEYPDFYWSCSEPRDSSRFVSNVRLSDGYLDWFDRANDRLSCRLVRVELAL